MTTQSRVDRGNHLLPIWYKELDTINETLLKAYSWIIDHPTHSQRRQQINKYFELKSKCYETDYWYFFCREFDSIGYSILTKDNKEYEITTDSNILELKSNSSLPYEFALMMSKRLTH